MTIDLQIDTPYQPYLEPEQIRLAVTTTLQQHHHLSSVELTVVISDNETVQQLNQDYRGVNKPTDVLSFGNDSDDFALPNEVITSYLGDIIIAYPIAEMQAKNAGHTILEEIILLVVHGTLHLLGFDHDTPSKKAAMWQAQQQVMTALTLPHVQPTET